MRKSAEDAAEKAGLFLVVLEARNAQEIENALAASTKERAQALLVDGDGVFFGQQQRLAQLALSNHLPTMFPQREYVEAGGLMSYGENLSSSFAGPHPLSTRSSKVHRRFADQQPTKFKLVINRARRPTHLAKIPSHLYIFADEVIE